ncbi:MAG TPA: OmpA family protein [Caulobacteraceae bacterium]|jgi:outer membrane protein OmpA-like peptidoglycan-associated protein|nr:OmpA family protein [Caulobacteraceae bacterium]
MRTSTPAAIVLTAVAAGALSLGGCATKGFVREQASAVDAKLEATQSQVAAEQTQLQGHAQKLSELDAASREALERAQAANQLAQGKFGYTMVLADDSIKFAANKADLSPEAQTRLLTLAEKLKSDNRNVYLEIQGYTDPREARTHRQLGAERAEAVRRFLNKQGVALNRMATISYGVDSPAAPNTTADGRAQNRRVNVVVMA